MIHFKFVGIKDMHNIYYLGVSGEQSLPFGLLVILYLAFPTIMQIGITTLLYCKAVFYRIIPYCCIIIDLIDSSQ